MTATRPSPRCRALLVEMSRYLDGELRPARRQAIETHIAHCHCCGTMASRLRTVVAMCRAEGRRTPPRHVRRKAAEAVRSLLAREKRGARRRPHP